MLLALALGLTGCSTRSPDPTPQTGGSEPPVAVSVDGERWALVKAFDRSGPEDRHFVLDRESGTIKFGDGRHGRRPPAGSRIEATYRTGSGAEGNLVSVSVVQPQSDRAELSLLCLVVKQMKDGIVIKPCEDSSQR
jgi:hypothetical protein